jgi:hypothetical protein
MVQLVQLFLNLQATVHLILNWNHQITMRNQIHWKLYLDIVHVAKRRLVLMMILQSPRKIKKTKNYVTQPDYDQTEDAFWMQLWDR